MLVNNVPLAFHFNILILRLNDDKVKKNSPYSAKFGPTGDFYAERVQLPRSRDYFCYALNFSFSPFTCILPKIPAFLSAQQEPFVQNFRLMRACPQRPPYSPSRLCLANACEPS